MKPPVFEYASPSSLSEAVGLLAGRDGAAKIISGGQSLMPMLAFRLAAPELLVDLKNCAGLDRIEISSNGVQLGAKVRWCDIEENAGLTAAHPLLAKAVEHVAHYQVRNRGTVGGSLAHADPAAELPGIAVTCDAQITILGSAGERVERASDFFTGVLQTTLEPDEIVTAMRLPAWSAQRRWAFLEFARRRGDFALAGVALHYDLDGDGRIVDAHIGGIGVSDKPVRLREAEDILNGQRLDDDLIEKASAVARASVDPLPDIHASPAYRASLLGTLLSRGLKQSAA